MTRFEYAVHVTTVPHQVPISNLAKNFHLAVEATESEGVDALQDPAVLLIGSFIAFQTHADVNTVSGYRKLLTLCHDQINAPKVTQ